MSKRSSNSGKLKQDSVINQFSRDIRQMESRTWLTIAEQCMQPKSKRVKTEEVRFSHYNPNNPLNGSSSWTREEQKNYSAKKSK